MARRLCCPCILCSAPSNWSRCSTSLCVGRASIQQLTRFCEQETAWNYISLSQSFRSCFSYPIRLATSLPKLAKWELSLLKHLRFPHHSIQRLALVRLSRNVCPCLSNVKHRCVVAVLGWRRHIVVNVCECVRCGHRHNECSTNFTRQAQLISKKFGEPSASVASLQVGRMKLHKVINGCKRQVS